MFRKLSTKYHQMPIATKATLWFIFCSTLQKCISLITTPIFTRIMSTTQYGQFNIYNSWLQILTIITTLRLNSAVFNKGMSKYKEDRDAYTSTMQTITAALAIVALLLYFVFHNTINALIELPTLIITLMFVELIVTPAIDFWTIRKRYEYIYKPVVIRTVVMTLLNAIFGVVVVLASEEKGYARIISCVIVNVCFGAALFVYNYKKGKRFFKKEYAVFALTFNLPLLLHYFSIYILDQFDRIMIQKMVSMSAAGIYSVAYNAGLMFKILTQSITQAIVPWQYARLEKQEFKQHDNICCIIFLIVGAGAILFSAVAPEIMRVLADQKYYEAVYVIPPVALSLFFVFLYTAFANVEFFYDQNKFTMYVSMGGALLNVILNYFGIKLFGYIAAAYTTLICYVLFTIAHYIYMSRSVKKALGCGNLFRTNRLVLLSIGVLLAGLIVIYLYPYPLPRYIIVLIGLLIGYKFRDKLSVIIKSTRKKMEM